MSHLLLLIVVAACGLCLATPMAAAQDDYPKGVQIVLNATKPLEHPRGDRLPLLLWTVLGTEVENDALQEKILRELDARGVATMGTWHPNNREQSLAKAMRLARFQQKLGLPIYINANPVTYSFFNGDESTAHLDDDGKPFFDKSLSIGACKGGCPFRIDHRYSEMSEQVAYFAQAYKEAGLPVAFAFADWEYDGPLEVNRAWEAAKKCKVCLANIKDLDDFGAFQKAVRVKRSDATKQCYADPILSRHPKALVGNYGVYPCDGYRYWYDFYERFVEHHPHRTEQKARYRQWFDEFPLTGYTFAMPTVYPWAPQYLWYDFENPDYRWFYNMLKVASNAGAHTSANVPIIPFVHFEVIYEPDPKDDSITQMSRRTYEELLWHMLLRGTDTFFLWCSASRAHAEIPPLHAVYAASLAYTEWFNHGKPVTFDIPTEPGPVVSGLRLGDRVLVRRTDFDDAHDAPVTLTVDGQSVQVARGAVMQVIDLH